MFRAGERNLITDVAGLAVGNSQDARLKSGATVVMCERTTTAGVQVLGGAPGTRETDLLAPHNLVAGVDAIVLSGGSAFGLDAASGVQAALREQGRGVEAAGFRIPIVPAAILFDLPNGGDKDWGRYPPYRELGYAAASDAGKIFPFGTEGAGAGATTANLKGGLGSASCVLESGITVGALVAVNAVGSTTVGDTPHFWAAPFEIGGEFGGLGSPSPLPRDVQDVPMKAGISRPGTATTLGVIATDAALSKAEAQRLAIGAHDGFARAIWPTHTPLDGDIVFALATGRHGVPEMDARARVELHAAAAATMARAIARGIYAARPEKDDPIAAWKERHQPPGA